MANALYEVPATSAFSEANFSIAGVVLNRRAYKSSSDLVEKRVFCGTNYGVLKKVGAIQIREKKTRTRISNLNYDVRAKKPRSLQVSCFEIFKIRGISRSIEKAVPRVSVHPHNRLYSQLHF